MSASAFGLRSGLLLKLTGLARLAADYEAANRLPAGRFEDRALQTLGIAVEAHGLDHLPQTGPLVIVANHPHGALDGLALLSAVRTTRSDVRLIANHLLARIPELHDSCFFIDPFGGPAAAERSRSGLRAAHLWLCHGGALIIFPSGEVAHRRAAGARRFSVAGARGFSRATTAHTPDDSEWHSTAGRLAAASAARVVLASIDGHNSFLFYAAGRIHPALRTALLPRELLRKRGSTVRISFNALAGQSAGPKGPPSVHHSEAVHHPRRVASIVPEVDRSALAEDIGRLPPARRLVDADRFAVYCAPANELPAALREIGRLREVTYRLAGEGTGRSIDLDQFDRTYLHLFTWDRRAQCIVGAYRLAPTDRIVASQGIEGLYTRRLFRFDARLFERLPPAIELGRSFVRAEYQRHYTALLLLWKGIGQYVVRNPRYRALFGPVSISTRYSDASHRLLMAFLLQNHRHAELAELVEAINPALQAPPPRGTAMPSTVAETEAMINRLEADGKGIPVLLRHYLKLNARVLGFNVDPAFGDVVDALMMVDLADVDEAILRRYFGRNGAERLVQARQAAA
jgi:putative hemolysin